MANRRMINSEMWEDDFFTALSTFEKLLWIGIITACADDQGRLQDNANIIRSKVFPTEDMPIIEIQGAVDKFIQAGRLDRYIDSGKHLLQIPTWWKHQTPAWAAASNYPPPKDWTDRVRVHRGKKVFTINWDMTGGYDATHKLRINLPIDLGNDEPLPEEDVNGDSDVNDDGNSDDESPPQPPSAAADQSTVEIWKKIRPDAKMDGIYALVDIAVKASMLRNNNKPELVAAEGKRFFTQWCNTKNKKGRFYSPDNVGWLDWWTSGEIPNRDSSGTNPGYY